MYSNYDFKENEDGKLEAIDQKTGEVMPAYTIPVPAGSRVYTPFDIQERKKRLAEEERREMIAKANANMSRRFTFINAVAPFSGLHPATIVRLIVLATYAGYDSRLRLNSRVVMERRHLKHVLRISDAAVSKFWREVSPRFVVEDRDGKLLLTDRSVFFRGRIKKNEINQFSRAFNEPVRAIYRAVPSSAHKLLGKVFALLPFVNIQFNILCYNPDEKDIHDVKPMSLRKFCEEIGYSPHNVQRLLSDYRKIRFRFSGKEETLIRFVNDGISVLDSWIIINPHIIYAGNQPEQVENFGMLSREQ